MYRDRRKFSLVILFSIDASLLLCNFLVPSPMLGLRNSDDSFSNGRWAPANHPSSSSSFASYLDIASPAYRARSRRPGFGDSE